MRIFVNEGARECSDNATVGQVAREVKPGSDLFILNGFPAPAEKILKADDRLVLIKKGDIPDHTELEVLLVSRHTPGVHQRLKEATIAIAGCGGLGSNAALALARAGVGHLILADFDIVEPSNLNRQQYFIDQIGFYKVDALKHNIERINPAVRVTAYPVLLSPENIPELFRPARIIIEAFDRADQKAMLVETCEKAWPGRPLILGLGMAGYGGNHLLHTRTAGALYICGDETTEAGPGIGLMAPRVGVVACLQANLALELLLGKDPRLQDPDKSPAGKTKNDKG